MKKITRLLGCLTACTLAALCAACGSGAVQNTDAYLVRQGISMAEEMQQLASNQEYLSLMSASEEIGALTEAAAQGDYSRPEAAFLLETGYETLFELSMQPVPEELPDGVIRQIEVRAGAALAGTYNGMAGAANVAATSLLTASGVCPAPQDWQASQLLFLRYPGEYSAMIYFTQPGEDILQCSAVFVRNFDDWGELLPLTGDWQELPAQTLEEALQPAA